MDLSDKKKVLRAIGQNIRAIRQRKEMSQQLLASLCGFEKSNMSRIEAGRSNVTILTLLKIAKALKVELKDLVDFESTE